MRISCTQTCAMRHAEAEEKKNDYVCAIYLWHFATVVFQSFRACTLLNGIIELNYVSTVTKKKKKNNEEIDMFAMRCINH